MLSIAIAYSIEDQAAAQRIANDLDAHLAVHYFGVASGINKALLAGMLDTFDGPLLLLLSDNWFKNENCLFGASSYLNVENKVVPIIIESRKYSEEIKEVITETVSLSSPKTRAIYQKYWSGQLESFRKSEALEANSTSEVFSKYLDRVRQVEQEIQALIADLEERDSQAEELLTDTFYEAIFDALGDDDLFETYRADRQSALLEAIKKTSEGPGFGAAAGAVPGEEKEQGEAEAEPDAIHDWAGESPNPIQAAGTDLGSLRDQSFEEDLDADNQAKTWINQAWEAFDNGNPEAGLELLATGKESLPDHPNVAYNYALMLAMYTQVPQAALLELQKLLDEFHDHAAALYLSGELSVLAGDYGGANLDWLQLRDVDPLYPNLNYRLGMLICEHFPERSSEAFTYLRRAAREVPPNGDARYRYAMMLYNQLGSNKKAIKWLKRAIDVSPEHAAAHYALAVLMHRKGKLTAARNYYRTAIYLDPSYDTEQNRQAFSQRLQMKSDTSVRGEKALKRLQARIAELESALAGRAPTSTAKEASKSQRTAGSYEGPGKGKIVFISGATSGIGKATAFALAKDGYSLILLGRRTLRLEALVNDLTTEYGIKAISITADVRDRATLSDALDRLPDKWKSIDVLLNNAGKAKGFDPIHEGNYDHWDEMIDVNLKGLLTLTREISPWMVARGTGTIINVCSTAGKEVYPNGNVYCATKHAVNALTYAIRLDLVKHGIRVGQICPAHVEETEFAVVRFDGDRQRARIYDDFQPLRSPDVAEAIRFIINQPAHVNIMDVVLQGTQQASSTVVDRSGRDKFAPKK